MCLGLGYQPCFHFRPEIQCDGHAGCPNSMPFHSNLPLATEGCPPRKRYGNDTFGDHVLPAPGARVSRSHSFETPRMSGAPGEPGAPAFQTRRHTSSVEVVVARRSDHRHTCPVTDLALPGLEPRRDPGHPAKG